MGKFLGILLNWMLSSWADLFSGFSPCGLLACDGGVSGAMWDWAMEMNVLFLVCLEVAWALSITTKGKTAIRMIKCNAE